MRPRHGILFFGFTEIAIGAVTLAATIASLLRHLSPKPLNVLLFVVVSGLISISLGIGVLLRRRYARKLLVFFAGWIILSKILIFSRIVVLCCSLETALPENLKNTVSILYHLLVIHFFHQGVIKAEFER